MEQQAPRIICMQCGRDLGPASGCSGDTHGICAACAKRLAETATSQRESRIKNGFYR